MNRALIEAWHEISLSYTKSAANIYMELCTCLWKTTIHLFKLNQYPFFFKVFFFKIYIYIY
jgi:hypothetical protein